MVVGAPSIGRCRVCNKDDQLLDENQICDECSEDEGAGVDSDDDGREEEWK